MLAFEKAISLVSNNISKLSSQKVKIEETVGMCLFEDIYSQISLPSFEKSLMDGYAVKAADIRRNRVLKCIGISKAGDVSVKVIKKGECVKVMTGAAIVPGADSVVKVEQTVSDGDCVKFLFKSIKKGENISSVGEIIKKDKKVLAKGTIIKYAHIALLASIGKRSIKVVRKPKVSILNTGGEIISLGEKIHQNQIYNCNGSQLLSLLSHYNAQIDFLGIVKDERLALSKAIKKGLKSDILLITGGVSMGDYDMIPDILMKLKVKKIFHKVKIKPGKPIFFGERNKKIVFGLPGNPLSTFVNYNLFVKLAIKKMMGYKEYKPVFYEGELKEDYYNDEKIRKYFAPVKIYEDSGKKVVVHIKTFGSSDVLSLSKADGFMLVAPKSEILGKGSKVKFIKV